MFTKRSLFLVPLLVATLFLAPSPQAAQAHDAADVGNAVVDYVPNLIHDVLDSFNLGITWGEGYGVDVRATHLLDIGCSEYEAIRYGFSGRELGPADISSSDKGLTLLGMTYGENSHDNYELGATVNAYLGVDGSINLRSLLDALAGLALIDLDGDNTSLGVFGGGDDGE